jgi:hypothetical protein
MLAKTKTPCSRHSPVWVKPAARADGTLKLLHTKQPCDSDILSRMSSFQRMSSTIVPSLFSNSFR